MIQNTENYENENFEGENYEVTVYIVDWKTPVGNPPFECILSGVGNSTVDIGRTPYPLR